MWETRLLSSQEACVTDYVEVASGDRWNLGSMGDYENQIPEGAIQELRLYTIAPVPDSVLQGLQQQLIDRGVPLVDDIRQGANVTVIRFKKGFPWLAAIATIIILIAVIIVLIYAWQLLREVPKALEGVFKAITENPMVAAALILGAGVLLISVVRRK